MAFVNLSRYVVIMISVSALVFSAPASNPNDLIANGTFDDGLTDWDWEPIHGAKATATVVDGQLVCDVTALAGSIFWEVQMRQLKLNIEKGVTYVFSFDAKAEPERSLIFGLERNDGHLAYDPDAGEAHPAKLTSTMQTFTSTFTMVEATDATARLTFSMGEKVSKITIDNVSLIDKTKITAIHPNYLVPVGSSLSRMIEADSRGISFRVSDPAHFQFQICSPSGRLVAGSNSFGNASRYRIEFPSLGISSGTYVVQAVDGKERYSRTLFVMP
jgi:hypothetical protein